MKGKINKGKTKKEHKIKHNKKFASKARYTGKISVHTKGFGFFVPDDQDMQDVFIPLKHINGAYNGDKVQIVLMHASGEKNSEGKVVKILERATKLVVGSFSEFGGGGYVEPDMRNINKDVFITKGNTMGAKTGDKVVARITSYGDETSEPMGEIIEIIGDMSRKGDDIIAIIRNYELYQEFPISVAESAKKISQVVPEEKKKGREDFRKLVTCTIDGEDARDFDDAISIEKDSAGNYVLGVHIADVGEYVPMGSEIDKEAYNRGTSVYFPDMVLPMIPKELSNGICSLNPKEDRLTLSVIIKLDSNANVVNYKICEGIINSNERMTYTDVQKVIDGDAEASKKYAHIKKDFLLMSELNAKLEAKENARGALDFDLPEVYIKVDEKGRTTDVVRRERLESHRIIESFMILANEVVAKHFCSLGVPFVYRVHEKPSEEKMIDFFKFASSLGFRYDVNIKFNNVAPKDLQKVILEAKGKPYEVALNEVMLRSLQKARYDNKCLGHFGLALRYYCHFTSPIRRYPDLTIHRIIKQSLHGKLGEKEISELNEFVMDSAYRSSEREVLADKAEREVEAYKKCEFMERFIGKEFNAKITGLTNNGVFVGLENTVEGFCSIENLPDDIYSLDEKMFTLTGQKYRFVIGQSVKVKLIAVNKQERHIDFALTQARAKNGNVVKCDFNGDKNQKNSNKKVK